MGVAVKSKWRRESLSEFWNPHPGCFQAEVEGTGGSERRGEGRGAEREAAWPLV